MISKHQKYLLSFYTDITRLSNFTKILLYLIYSYSKVSIVKTLNYDIQVLRNFSNMLEVKLYTLHNIILIKRKSMRKGT